MTRTFTDRYPGLGELVARHRSIPLPLRIAALHGGRNTGGDLASPEQAVVERLKGPQPIAGIRSAIAQPRKDRPLVSDSVDHERDAAGPHSAGSG